MKKIFLLSLAFTALTLLATPPSALAKDDAAAPGVKATQKHRAQARPGQRNLHKQAAARKKPVQQAARPALPTVIVSAKPSTDVLRPLTQAGDYRFVIQHGGFARTYRVHVPQRYNVTEPAPLLVALHGGGIARPGDDGFDSLAAESEYQGFVAVYPDGYAGKGKPASWNAGQCCGDARTQNVNDVGFIEQVVNNVFKQVSIDRQRIYAAGFSDGGMMAYRLACELPEVFKAVASVGGADNTTTCAPGKPVSVLQLHARNDPRVPLASAPATAAKWAELNRCESAPRRILDQAGAYCDAYTYCGRQTAVELCVTETGGHSWPGAKARTGGEPPSQAIAGTRAMWAFFSAH